MSPDRWVEMLVAAVSLIFTALLWFEGHGDRFKNRMKELVKGEQAQLQQDLATRVTILEQKLAQLSEHQQDALRVTLLETVAPIATKLVALETKLDMIGNNHGNQQHNYGGGTYRGPFNS